MAFTPQMSQGTSSLSPDMYQSAATYQLGAPLTIYRVTTTTRRAISGVILIVIGLGAVGLGASGLYQSSLDNITPLLTLLIGLICGAIGLYLLVYPLIYKNWCVAVFEHGFLYKKGSNPPQPFPWQQVEAVWYQVTRHYTNGIYTGTTHRYRVRRADAYEIVLNDRFTNVGQLGDTINNQVTRCLLPKVNAAYNAGQTVTFGPLSLNRQGIINDRGTLLPWQEIRDVEIQRGYISVKKANAWLRWSSQSVSNIPNVFVFIALVRAILGK